MAYVTCPPKLTENAAQGASKKYQCMGPRAGASLVRSPRLRRGWAPSSRRCRMNKSWETEVEGHLHPGNRRTWAPGC